MPQIKPYTSQVGATGPVNQRRAEAVSIGPGLNKLGEGIGQLGEGLYDVQASDEINKGSAALAKLRIEKLDELNNMARQGSLAGDTRSKEDKSKTKIIKDALSNYNDFIDDYNNKASAISEELTTSKAKNYFNKISQDSQADFQQKFYAIRQEQAGDVAEAAFRQNGDYYGTMIYKNPQDAKKYKAEYFDFLSKVVDRKIMSPTIIQKHNEEEKKKFAKYQVLGTLNGYKDGISRAKKLLENKDVYMDLGADGIEQMHDQIRQKENAVYIDSVRSDLIQKKREKKLTDKAIAEYTEKLADGSASAQDIFNDPNIPDSAKPHLMNVAQNLNNKNMYVNYDLAKTVFDNIHAEEGDPKRINDVSQFAGFVGKGLDINSFKTLKAEFDKVNSPEYGADQNPRQTLLNKAFDYYRANPDSKDPRGNKRGYNFAQYLIKAEELAAQKGIPPSELYKETSPNYMGKEIKNFKSQTMQEKVKETLKQRTGNYKVPKLIQTTNSPAVPPEEALKGRK